MKESYLEKARRLLDQGDYQKALLTISRGLITQPSNVEAIRLKCQCLMELGRYREVIATVDSVPDSLRRDTELQTFKGEAYYFLRDYKRAYKILSDVYSRDPNSSKVQILLEQILLEQQKALGHKPTVVGTGDAEDFYGWKDVLESLGLEPGDMPPEFLSRIGDESTALDLPADDEEDPTKTMPVDVPSWLEDGGWDEGPGYDNEDNEEPTPIVEEDPIVSISYTQNNEPTRKGPPQDAPTRLVAQNGGLPPRRSAPAQNENVPTSLIKPRPGQAAALEDDENEIPTREYTLAREKTPALDGSDLDAALGEPPTKNYSLGRMDGASGVSPIPSQDEPPTKDYNLGKLPARKSDDDDDDDFGQLPTQEYTPKSKSGKKPRQRKLRKESTGDFVMEFHSIDPLEAPPQEELSEVGGEIEVTSDDSVFSMEPEYPSISVDLTSLEELPPLPSLSEGPSLPPIPEPDNEPEHGDSALSALLSEGSGPKPEFIDALINSATPQVPPPPPPNQGVPDIERIVQQAARKAGNPAPTIPFNRMDPQTLHVRKKRRHWLLGSVALVVLVVLIWGLLRLFGVGGKGLDQHAEMDRLLRLDNKALKAELSRLSDYSLNHEDAKWVSRVYTLGYLKARLTGWYSPLMPKGPLGDPMVDGLMNVFNQIEEGRPTKALQELDKLNGFMEGCPLCTTIAARMYVLLDRPVKAQKLLNSLKFKGKLGPGDACMLVSLAVDQGAFQEAEEALQYFSVQYPKAPCMDVAKAELKAAQGELTVSEKLLETVLQRQDLSPRLMVRARIVQAITLVMKGKTEGLKDTLQSTQELIPKWDLDILTRHARWAMYMGDYERASKELKEILKLMPTHARARALRRESLFRLGRIGDIIKEGRATNDPVIALAYLVYGDVPRAQRYMSRWGKMSSPLASIAKGLLNVRLGRPDAAEEALGPQPPESNPYAPLWAWIKAEILMIKGVRCNAAVKPLERYGKRALLWERLVRLECLLRTRQWVAAVELFNKSVKEFRGADILEPLGLSVMRVMGEFKELAPKLKDYVATLSSAHYQWYTYLAEAYRYLGQWKDAQKALEDGLRHGMPGEVYYIEQARNYLVRRYWKSLMRPLRKLSGVASSTIAMERDVYRAIAVSHRRKPEDGFSILEPYASVYHPLVYWGFAEIYCMSKDLDQAVKFYDGAMELARKNNLTPWEMSRIAAAKARCLYANKEYHLARKAAVAALALTPLQYEASLVLARMYLKFRDTKNAIYYYNSVLRANPTHPEAVCRIGLLLGPGDPNGLAYLKLCRTLRDAPRGLRRRARRMLR